MRLSVKGIQKYTDHRVYYEYPIETLKFEPDDFEGAVVLTVEEAKGVAKTYDALASFLIKCMDGDGAKEAIAFAIELNKRIEQAEKSNES